MKTTSIINKRAEADVDASEYETLALSIDSNGVEHLMSTLTNLYSNPLESVFREYVSNALDSHIKSKNKAPIKVDVIKGYNAVLRVQDFGTGMNKDDIVNVYSKYASSTKRDSNEQIGAFGLGAKSALAIASRFDVTSIKDGIELVFFIKKNSRGAGVVHFVSEVPTDKANGVTVTIPLTPAHVNELAILTADNGFFSTWDPKLVRFNGASIKSDINVYNEDSFLTLHSGSEVLGWVSMAQAAKSSSNNTRDKISLTICGIRYKLDTGGLNQGRDALLSKLVSPKVASFYSSLSAWNFNLILSLPVGSVDLTPSRENIMITEKTRKTLNVALESAAVEVPRAMASKLNKQPFEKAFDFYARNLPAFGIPNGSGGTYEYFPDYDSPAAPVIKYKSDVISPALKIKSFCLQAQNASAWEEKWHEETEISYFSVKFNHGCGRTYSNNRTQGFYIGRAYRSNFQAIVVYGIDSEENRATIKRNARSYSLAKHDNPYVTIYFVPTVTAPSDTWLLSLVTPVTIDELEKIGKAYRSDKAKEAAANRAPGVKRAVSIHYGAVYDESSDTFDVRKFSVDEIRSYNEVIKISATEEQPSNNYYSYKNPAFHLSNAFWSGLADMYGSSAMDQHMGYDIMLRAAKTFSGSLIIAIPSNRAVGPIEKANANTVSLSKAIENRFTEINKNKNNREVLKAISEVVTERTANENYSTGIRKLVDVVCEAGQEVNITNKLTRKVFEQIGKRSEYADLILLGRIFVNLAQSTITAMPKKYEVLLPYLYQDGIIPTSGMGTRYSLIDTDVDVYTVAERARIFVSLINALDKVLI